MSFLRVNGLDIDVMVDDFSYEIETINDFQRGAEDLLEGSVHAYKRILSITTNFMTKEEAYSLENWVCGNFHVWDFANGIHDKSAKISWTPSVHHTIGEGTRFAGYNDLIVPSASSPTVLRTLYGGLYLKNDGVSVGAWTRPNSDSNYIFGCVTVGPRGDISYVSGVVDTAYNVALDVDTSLVDLPLGHQYVYPSIYSRDAGSATVLPNARHTGVIYAPFQFTPGMVSVLSTMGSGDVLPYNGFPRPPFVAVHGDCLLGDGESFNTPNDRGMMVAKGYIEGVEYLAGGRRRLSFKLEER